MRVAGVGVVGRRASFSVRFALILAGLGALIAGATAAIPLQLSASDARSVALDRAADKAGTAFNLIAAQRTALREYLIAMAQQLAVPLQSGDRATAAAVLIKQSTVAGPGDVLGSTDGTVVVGGAALPDGDAAGAALLLAARRGQPLAVGVDGTPWLVERVTVPGVLPLVEVFVGRPMRASFVRQLAADVGSGADAASLAVARDGAFISGAVAARGAVQHTALPDALRPALRNPGGAVLADVNGTSVAAAAVGLGAGVTLLASTPVGSNGAFQLSAVVPVAIIAVAMILMALLVVYVIVQRDLQRPLQRLDRAVAGLEREDFDVPIPSGSDDELGRLGSSFERMRRTLRATLSGAEARATVAGELAAPQPLQSALENVCGVLQRTTGARAAVIAVAASDMADAYVIATGLDAPLDAVSLLDGAGPLAAAVDADTAVPVMATALPGTPEAHAHLRDLCCSRLAVGSHVLGVLAIADKEDGFNPADAALVVAAAEQVALALERYHILAVAQRQASTDELTGLYNYRFLVDYLDQQIALAERLATPLAVLMLDLDRFKLLNDTHGHHAGDEALRAFATTLHNTIRRADLAARYGGEEFVVVMSNTNREEARLVAEKIRRAVAELELRFGGELVTFTVSIGGVAYPDDTGDARQLLELADDALYQAKRTGRDRVCFVSDRAVRRTLTGTGGPWPVQPEDADEHGTSHRPAQ